MSEVRSDDMPLTSAQPECEYLAKLAHRVFADKTYCGQRRRPRVDGSGRLSEHLENELLLVEIKSKTPFCQNLKIFQVDQEVSPTLLKETKPQTLENGSGA